MDNYTFIGIQDVDFTGSDGKRIVGNNLFFTYEQANCDGLCAVRVFVNKKKFNELSFIPELGSQCQIMYNRFGKVADIVKV